ncbi:CRAL-TRIO domain-containing protein C3H8.02 [Paramyrothecium foliicola]|nr:CRAL-TRIO domain-containing protein C3H8.02 [Paramyrothecium foliicola]
MARDTITRTTHQLFEQTKYRDAPPSFFIKGVGNDWSIGLSLRQLIGFTRPTAANHTMSHALVEYCLKRLPIPHLERLAHFKIPFELHAAPFQVLRKHHKAFGFDWVERLVWRTHDLHKPYNFIRPELLLARKSCTKRLVAILTIMPGEDYIRHYASILEVAQHAGAIPGNDKPIHCVLYPHLTKSIMNWTGLTELAANVEPGDVVVLGFVAELLLRFTALVPTSQVIWRQDSEYYSLVRLEIRPGVIFSLVGAKYSYWGNLGGIIVKELAARRPRAICYVAKQGTLVSPDDIHSRIYSPTRYCIFDKGEACWHGDDHPALPINPISSRFPTFDRGLHASTPTIVEQDVEFRTQLTSHGAVSIDNELAQMAKALTDVHEENPSMPRIQLLPLMFITDYLRRPEELSMSVPFDLTSRNKTVQRNKDHFLARAAHLVLEAFDLIQRPKAVIVGTGYGVKTILPALERRGVEVVGLCGGGNRDKTESIATKHKIPCVDLSLGELQACHGANLLFIASPHDKHSALVQEALDLGGFDIICEKPLALDTATMRRFIDQSRRSSQLCLMNHPLRFYPPFIHMKDATKDPKNILSINIQFFTKRLAKLTHWNPCFSKAAGGGMMLAMATHFLDLIEWLTDSQLSHDSVETIAVTNSTEPLLTADTQVVKTPDVESAFKMSGYCRFSTSYSIECDGAANTELFSVSILFENKDEVRFSQQKGGPVLLEQRRSDSEWFPMKVKLEQRVRDGSSWQISFQYFVEEEGTIVMTDPLPPGYLGNLTVEEKRKLQQAWTHLFRLCAIEGTEDFEPFSKTPDRSVVFQTQLSDKSPQRLRSLLWSFIAQEHPDVLVLRFLRARKWDVEMAVSMLVSAVDWRGTMRIDEEIIKVGEGVALKPSMTVDEKDFMEQYRSGKSYVRGSDNDKQAIYIVKVRLHEPSAQSPQSMEKYVLHTVESLRVLRRFPFDKACLLFDMTGLSLRNVDLHVVRFLIEVFEARYPETLAVVCVHNAPFIFWGLWRIIKPLMDPVVAEKINFTKTTADLLRFIPKENLQQSYGGEDPWEFKYEEPVAGENWLLEKPEERSKVQQERNDLARDFEQSTLEWLCEDPTSASGKQKDNRRDDIAKRLNENYWDLDPYIRARTFHHRVGIVGKRGEIDFKAAGIFTPSQ